MLRSSLGFHTMTLNIFLLYGDAKKLWLDFIKYSKNTTLKIYWYKDGTYIPYTLSQTFLPTDSRIYFDDVDRGIRWHIYSDDMSSGMAYIIETTINPKILGGITDYLTAATYNDMRFAIPNFNSISRTISPLLTEFADYRIKRIDYCLNICLDDFLLTCTPEQIVNLIKRSDIPPHYKEWIKRTGCHL